MYLYAYCFLLNFSAYRCIPVTYLCTYCLIVYSYLREISRSQGSECDTAPCSLVESSPWWWRQDALLEHQSVSRLHGAMSRRLSCHAVYVWYAVCRSRYEPRTAVSSAATRHIPSVPLQTSVCVGISSLFSHSMQLLGWATTASFHVPPSSQDIVELHKSLGQIILCLDMPILR